MKLKQIETMLEKANENYGDITKYTTEHLVKLYEELDLTQKKLLDYNLKDKQELKLYIGNLRWCVILKNAIFYTIRDRAKNE